jgi:hypothetical protein
MDEDNARRNHNDKAMERKGTNKEEKKGERRAGGKFKEGRHEIHIGEEKTRSTQGRQNAAQRHREKEHRQQKGK